MLALRDSPRFIGSRTGRVKSRSKARRPVQQGCTGVPVLTAKSDGPLRGPVSTDDQLEKLWLGIAR